MKLPCRTNWIALTLIAFIAANGCAEPPPVNSRLSEDDKKTLTDEIGRLQTALDDKSPFVAEKLAPGATEAEILSFRSAVAGAQLDELEIWFKWHNGCTDSLTDLIPLGRMLSISESLEARKLAQSTPFVDAKIKKSLKLLEDLAGDGFYMDLTEPNPRVFYCMLEDPQPTYYGTLQEFVAFVSEVHEAGLASLNGNGMIDFDQDRYQELKSRHLANTDQSAE